MNRPIKEEHEPGDPVPETGWYHLVNVFGSHTGESVLVHKGQPLPQAPRGFRWTLHESPDC